MASQQFRVKNGLLADSNVSVTGLFGGDESSGRGSSVAQGTGGRILCLDAPFSDTTANVIVRTGQQLRTDINAGRVDTVESGDGISVSAFDTSAGSGFTTQTVSLGTPSTVNAETTSAATTGTHTHSLDHASDVTTGSFTRSPASAASDEIMLSANTIGGLKLHDLALAGNGAVTGHVSVGADLTVTGNTTVSGSLQVDGTLTYVNTTNLSVTDPLISLAADLATSAAVSNEQGLHFNRGNEAAGNAVIIMTTSEQFEFGRTTAGADSTGTMTLSDYAPIKAGGGTFDDTVTVNGTGATFSISALNATDATTGGAGSIKTSGGIYATKKIIAADLIQTACTTHSTSSTTGAAIVAGGIGVGANSYFHDNITVKATTDSTHRIILDGASSIVAGASAAAIGQGSSAFLMEVAIASYNSGDITVVAKGADGKVETTKLLIGFDASGTAMNVTEYGKIGQELSTTYAVEMTDGSGNAGTTDFGLKCTNGESQNIKCTYHGHMLKTLAVT